ncbi:SRPBCC domain-containing protein [Arthrobacter sp. SLBN-53]|uniref:SRPBCC family protein n=1 Tax=Arthrobacter sp. SLBN-53 TaxID=2768412 RepID=UPI00116878AA|nr:SRPBCC domain-containing protein [Arthrobacter sp. SLBN-53]TQK31416.1 uncharacterized protein YndB with AHSA1/START domain [Arthrobacter sp. SLBN-53]
MPVRHDDEKRWIELGLTVDAGPEQVWHALATGAGNSAWFTRSEIEEKVGGVIRFDFGPAGDSAGEVTRWDPPRHFGYIERDWSGDAPPLTTQITVNDRLDGRCDVAMVHSLVTDRPDWDAELEGFEAGWAGHFAVLRNYLRHFAGRRAVGYHLSSTSRDFPYETWKRFTEAMHLHGVDVGDLRTVGITIDNINGQVEWVQQDDQHRHVLVRLAEPLPGLVLFGMYTPDGKAVASLDAFFYGEDAHHDAEVTRTAWQRLLESVFG